MEPKVIISELRDFVEQEQRVAMAQLIEVWETNLVDKLQKGLTQKITSIETFPRNSLALTLGENESRFREGDMICLHNGNPFDATTIRQGVIEAENDGDWLVRFRKLDPESVESLRSGCYVDQDQMDLSHFYNIALDDISESEQGTKILLPLLAGELNIEYVYPDSYDEAANAAEEQDLNEKQADAVGLGVASCYLACIQGPPGTGKTKVISLIAKLLVENGDQVLMTSFTHMAINNAINKIHEMDVPVAKIGAFSAIRGLQEGIATFEKGCDWTERPDNGYVIGATPFATCTQQLEDFSFDTVIFDEASQITVPLALMAMRKAKRFVFVGDHKQLPPVIMARSILDKQNTSIFSKLITHYDSYCVMLNTTYRMNQELADWPAQRFYDGDLVSFEANKNKRLLIKNPLTKHKDILAPEFPFVFVASPGINCKTKNNPETELVLELIHEARQAGVELSNIGVVSPFRNHAKNIRKRLSAKYGSVDAKKLVVDTVERMQGQESEMIIISLCATNTSFISGMCDFLLQSERLNVALTRAKSKLVLIGPMLADLDSAKLSKDSKALIEQYHSMLNYAHRVNL